MNIFKTRLILLKKQWLSLLFWIVFPLLITIIVINLLATIGKDSRIPISIVLEEETPITLKFKKEISTSSLVRLVELPENNALNELEKHNLDSVFIVDADFDRYILEDRRVAMITGYKSDLSFAYLPVKELILSHLQRHSGRSKMVHFIHDMSNEFNPHTEWEREELIKKANSIENEENLLQTTLEYSNKRENAKEDLNLIKPWNIWAIFSILASFFIFDWIIKEKNTRAIMRLTFTRFSMKSYVLINFLIYTILLIFVDLITIPMMRILTQSTDSFLTLALNLFYFRLIISIITLILSANIHRLFMYYSLTFIIVFFFTLTSSALFPITALLENYDWIYYLNPLQAFIKKDYRIYWPILLITLVFIWFFKKERSYASRL